MIRNLDAVPQRRLPQTGWVGWAHRWPPRCYDCGLGLGSGDVLLGLGFAFCACTAAGAGDGPSDFRTDRHGRWARFSRKPLRVRNGSNPQLGWAGCLAITVMGVILTIIPIVLDFH